MKLFRTLVLTVAALSMTGCAGLFVAGAATTASLVIDPRSTQEIWSDNNIEFEITGLGNKAPFRGNARVTASSYNGTVILLGQANTAELSEQFEGQARKVKGVDTIHNQLKIKQPLSVGQISHDSWITTKVKSALLANSELNGVKIKVITEDKEVYLLGYVSHEHADIATDIARNVSDVKQVIRAFQFGD
ncbi:BON domain-containing protein [Vibrio atypicus]|jgi:osmotically-inducible protein OsmY|uniref:BON domain-containing protein n=1 Tax=Vibrio atypicus TaxID=558271 RepID=UPI00135A79C7|nr:BON domain-containing protein [Vibrio atypicus]